MSYLPKAKKELGQHFLRDKNVIKKITQDWSHECDVIIEVGPGPTVLTTELVKHEKPIFVIEKDTSFAAYINKIIPSDHVFLEDALKFDWCELIKNFELENKKIWLVSNLPYNVGTVLFTQFLKIKQIQFMTLMFQKEVGEKTYHRETKNQMSGLLSLSQNYFKPKLLTKVSPGCFSPAPKVDSVVVSYARNEHPTIIIDRYDMFNQFTRNLFGQRRKQIGSVLRQSYDKQILEQSFVSLNIPSTLRAEALTFEQVIKLFMKIHDDV